MADAVAKVRKVLEMARAEAFTAAALARRTRAQLLEAAEELGLAGLTKLQKAPLAARLLKALGGAGAPAGTSTAPGAGPTRAAPAAKAAPAKRATPARKAPKAEAAEPKAAAPRASRAARGFAGKKPATAARKVAPVAAPKPEPEPEELLELEPAGVAKLDLGPAARAGERPVAHIPWSYGTDRVTAAAIDPDRLFIWWELTDPAIERARARLGPGGPSAWPNLRVYDTSGRIFDGTNAHSYADFQVERSDRRWFVEVGKPSSTAVVEVGLKSSEGFFVRVARSGRVDFPSKEAAPWQEPEWMTVLPGGVAQRGSPPPRAIPAGAGPVAGPATRPAVPAPTATPPPATIPLWILRQPGPPPEEVVATLLEGRTERVEWREEAGQGWVELQGSVEWVGPHSVTSWQAGPFAEPIEIEPPTAEAWQGHSFAYRVGGVTHVVHGPWQVVIRNLGARAERAELSRWQVYRSWVATAGREVRAVEVRPPAVPGGSSEGMAGASERRWLEGSELLLGGASEVWRASASELRLGGASERGFAGASERVERGASERRLQGGSEARLGGASEQLGGSEGRLGAGPGDPDEPGDYPKAGG